jgi:hypothetical protein
MQRRRPRRIVKQNPGARRKTHFHQEQWGGKTGGRQTAPEITRHRVTPDVLFRQAR